MKRRVPTTTLASISLLAIVVLVAPGCVQRILVVRSEPSGADVYINGQNVGTTPLEYEFEFYLPMDIELRKYDARNGGYRVRHLVKDPKIPWHQYFPLDLVTEFMVPWPIHDVHHVDVELERETRTVDALRVELEGKVHEIRRTLVLESDSDGDSDPESDE